MSPDSLQWFAIWTRSRHEQVVREQLERKLVDAFLPTVPKWSRWKDRKKKIDWPLFPGYCFARFDPANTLAILKCAGVVNIVSFEGKPAPIPEYELENIRVLEDVRFVMKGGQIYKNCVLPNAECRLPTELRR